MSVNSERVSYHPEDSFRPALVLGHIPDLKFLCVFVYLSQIVRMPLPWWYVLLQNRRTCYSVSS